MSTLPTIKPYDTWVADPSTNNLRATVDSLKPTVDHVLYSIKASDDPFIRSKARVLTAKAVQSYDPAHGAALPTWVSRQLLPLRRVRRQSQGAVRIPEGIQIDAYSLMRAEQEFFEKNEREPNIGELSDFAKMPAKRIAHIRKVFRPVPSESAFSSDENPDGFGTIGAGEPDYSSEAFDYVYNDADHLDRRILEMKTGFGGTATLNGKEIARKLGLTEPQLSRRSAKLSMQIHELENALNQV